MNQDEVLLVDQEIQEMLRKGAMLKVQPSPDQFLRSIFVNSKKDAEHRPVIN